MIKLVPNTRIYYNVCDYGATGNGSTDDKIAIQAAADAAAADSGNGGTLYFPPKTFYIASGITIESHVEGVQAIINTDQNITAITLGDGSNYLRDKKIYLPRVKDTSKVGTGWSGASVGVKCVNLLECEIHTSCIENFSSGLLITTSGAKGTAYNQFYLSLFDDNKIQLKLAPVDQDGWVNENTFYGGRFLFNDAEGTAVSGTRNIQIETYAHASAHLCNNNRFYAPSLEGNVPEYHADIFGGWNYIRDARWEATTPKVNLRSFSSSKFAQRNVIQGGYNAESIVYTNDSNSKWNILHDDVMWADLVVTDAQFKALNSSPLTIVPAPGVGKTFHVLGFVGRFNYGGVAQYTHAGSLIVSYAGSTALTQATLGGGANFYTTGAASAQKFGGPVSNVNIRDNDALVIFASSANPTGGNAGNTFKFRVYYRIVSTTL
jgi:hypothetical protein